MCVKPAERRQYIPTVKFIDLQPGVGLDGDVHVIVGKTSLVQNEASKVGPKMCNDLGTIF